MHQKLKHPFYSYTLVAAQFGLIGLLLISSYPWQWFMWSIAAHLGGALLGLWALKTMHLGHFNIIPDPLPHLQLVTTGPYAFIRHPMYASILLFCLPFPLLEPSLTNNLIFLALTLTLLLKLHYEEALIIEQTPDYLEYRQHSKKLIPWIY